MADEKVSTDQVQLRVLDAAQLKFVRIYCSGGGTVDNTAALVDVTTGTAKRWMRKGHAVRAEVERRLQAKRQLLDALVDVARNPRSTATNRMEAYREAMHLMGFETAKQAREDFLLDQEEFRKLYEAAFGRVLRERGKEWKKADSVSAPS